MPSAIRARLAMLLAAACKVDKTHSPTASQREKGARRGDEDDEEVEGPEYSSLRSGFSLQANAAKNSSSHSRPLGEIERRANESNSFVRGEGVGTNEREEGGENNKSWSSLASARTMPVLPLNTGVRRKLTGTLASAWAKEHR